MSRHSPEGRGRAGDNDISPLDDEPNPVSVEEPPADIMSHSIDPRPAQQLWELSEKLLAA